MFKIVGMDNSRKYKTLIILFRIDKKHLISLT